MSILGSRKEDHEPMSGGVLSSRKEWTDDDYAKLIEESKRLKGLGLGVDRVMLAHKLCPDCKRPVANIYDESIHNTGECGCITSRALCWRSWNGNKCCKESPYARTKT